MPAGDPAGYLPNVLKARKRKGQKLYQPRRRGPIKPSIPKGDPLTGGTEAPSGPAKPYPLPKIRPGTKLAPPFARRNRPGSKRRKYTARPR